MRQVSLPCTSDPGAMNEDAFYDLTYDGFCILKSVLSAPDAAKFAKMANQEWSECEHMAHSKSMWGIRTSAVRRVFEHIYDTTDLITSFDGMTCKFPDGDGLVLGYHIDQTQNMTHCYQSIVALTASDASTGSVAFLVGSHNHYTDTLSRYGGGTDEMHNEARMSRQYVELAEDDVLITRLNRQIAILRPGDMVLWDSRTVHCVDAATESRSIRLVAYVCMVPRGFASPRTIRRRRAAFLRGASSTHWPHLFVTHKQKKPGARQVWSQTPQSIASLV